MTRCAIFNQAPHSSEGTHTVTVRPLFVPGPEAGGSGGSGLYWFVCNLNPSLCIGLFLCHPPVSPASPSGAESLFFFLVGGNRRWKRGVGYVTDERTCLVELWMDVRVKLIPLSSIQCGVTSPCPAHIHRQPCLTGLTTTLKVWKCDCEAVFSVPSRSQCKRRRPDSRVRVSARMCQHTWFNGTLEKTQLQFVIKLTITNIYNQTRRTGLFGQLPYCYGKTPSTKLTHTRTHTGCTVQLA